jgi:hypothetical protein
MIGVVIGVSTSIIATGITFYLKDYLIERAKFKRLEKKLKPIAGKEAEVIIPNIGIVKITDINNHGITVKDKLCTTFLPMERVLLTDIGIPFENYDALRKELMRKNVEESLDIVFPPLMDKLKEVMVTEFLKPDSELSAFIALKIRGEIREEGISVNEWKKKRRRKKEPRSLKSAQQQKTNWRFKNEF